MRIVIAEENQGDFAGLADLADKVDDLGKRGMRFQGALGGALDGGAVGERIAEGDAEFDDVGASFRESADKFVHGFEGGIASGDVGDDA